MRRALALVINHGVTGLLRAVPWRIVGGSLRQHCRALVALVPWRIVALVSLALCVVVPFVLGRLQPFRGSLAEAEAMSILYIVGVLGLLAWALWAVVGFWVRRASRGKG